MVRVSGSWSMRLVLSLLAVSTMTSCHGNGKGTGSAGTMPKRETTRPGGETVEPSFHRPAECPKGIQGKWVRTSPRSRKPHAILFSIKDGAIVETVTSTQEAFILDGGVQTGGASESGTTTSYVGSCLRNELIIKIKTALSDKDMESSSITRVDGDVLTRTSKYNGVEMPTETYKRSFLN